MVDRREGKSLQAIPSRALAVWRRLYLRFALEPGPASVGPDVAKMIQPVTLADDLLRTPTPKRNQTNPLVNINFTAYTVPLTEHWTLLGWDLQRLTGDRTLNTIEIDPGTEDAGPLYVLKRPSNVKVDTVLLAQGIPMLPSWAFVVRMGAGATSGNWNLDILVNVEAAYIVNL